MKIIKNILAWSVYVFYFLLLFAMLFCCTWALFALLWMSIGGSPEDLRFPLLNGLALISAIILISYTEINCPYELEVLDDEF